MSIHETFDGIYRDNAWGGTESRSGPGSGSVEREQLAPDIVNLVAMLDVRSVLDIGCGETYWTPELPGYIGIDVSSEAIAVAKQRHPDWDLRIDDGSPLPQRDLVMMRCVLQHLSFRSALHLLNRIDVSGATWLLCTSYNSVENEDIDDGGGYWANISIAPFDLGSPLIQIEDGRTDNEWHDAILGLWRLQ